MAGLRADGNPRLEQREASCELIITVDSRQVTQPAQVLGESSLIDANWEM